MSPYRDSLDALRARLAEVERAIAEQSRKKAAPSFGERANWHLLMMVALAVALTVIGISLYHLQTEYRELARYQAYLDRPQPPVSATTPRHWRARVFTSDVAHLADGAECTVAIDPPCTATVSCDKFGYRGRGSCSESGFVDRADSELDCSPECEIDVRAGRVLLRELGPYSTGGIHRRWFAELELVRE